MIRGDDWIAEALEVLFNITIIIDYQKGKFGTYMSPRA